MNNKRIVITSVLVAVLVVATLTATYAYFQARIGTGSITNTAVTAKTIDGLTFNQGTSLAITATQTNFASGKGNLSSSTSPTVTLKARNDAAASYNYKACLNVTENTFVHSQISSTETSNGRTVNLFDISKVITNSEVKNNQDGTLSIIRSTSSDGVAAATPHTLKDYCPNCTAGTTYVLQANSESDGKYIYLSSSSTNWHFGTARTLTVTDLSSRVYFYGNAVYDGGTIKVSNIQIEEGTTATPYDQYGYIENADLELTVTKNGTTVLTQDITHGYGEICIPTTNGGSTTTHTISAAAGATTTDTWNATVTFKNYNNNQNINLDKTFNSNFVFTRI